MGQMFSLMRKSGLRYRKIFQDKFGIIPSEQAFTAQTLVFGS